MTITPLCTGCHRTPNQIDQYRLAVASGDDAMDADEYVRLVEGTYNPENEHFLCTACYVAAGMPTSPGGWIAP